MIIDKVLKAIEKFLSRIKVVRRGYEENHIEQESWKTRRFYAFMDSIVVLGKDKEANKKKIEGEAKRNQKWCEAKVKADIERHKKTIEEKDGD